MQKVFTYKEASNYFRKLLDNGELAGHSYLFLGKEGTGKTQLLGVLDEYAKKSGFKVFRARSYASNEALMYQAYNELLNQYFGTFKERTLPEIVEAFSSGERSQAEKIIFIIDGLENMLQNSRELFIYLSRTSQRLGFAIFGTITEDYVEDGHSIVRFLNLVSNEPDIRLVNFERATLEDIKFLLKELGYNLPVSFVQEVFRLTNGNIRSLSYTLRYYQDQGIINEKHELEEVTYRYFPIPPSSELRFEQIIRELGRNERTVLEVISLIQEELSPRFISVLTQLGRESTVEALEKLKRYGLVSESNLNYSIVNTRIGDIVINSIYTNGGYIITDSFVSQEVFRDLPFITRLKVYQLRKDRENMEDLVNHEWRDIIDKISYISFSQDLFENIQKIVTGKEAKAHLSLMVAQSLQNMGDLAKAMEIYTSEEIKEIEPVYSHLSAAKLQQRMDQYRLSLDACESLLKRDDVSEYDRVTLLNLIAINYSSLNLQDTGEQYALESIKLAEKNGFNDLLADALSTMGTLMVRRFDLKKALEHYQKSLDICQTKKLFDRELLMLNNVAIIYSYWGDYDQSAKMLTEIIEKSYISGELMSRAYATYNLCEIYYNIGKKDDFRSYFPSAAGLVRMVTDGNLAYPFFRFASLVSLDMMLFDSGRKYSEELLRIASAIGNDNRVVFARGLGIMNQDEPSPEAQKELEDILMKEINDADDFLPTWYFMGGLHFCLKGDLDKAEISLERVRKSANILGDSLGFMVAELGDAFRALMKGDRKTLGEIARKGFHPGNDGTVFKILTEQFVSYCDGTVTEDQETMVPDTIVNLSAMVLMGMKPAGIERGGLDNFMYFLKCRHIIGKEAIPI